MADSLYEYEELRKLSRPPAPTVDDEGDVLSVGVDGEGRPRYQLDPPSGGASSWDDIAGKPSTFPPSTHAHEIADIAGLAAALAALQPLDTFRDNGSSSSVDWSLGTVQYIAATSNLALTFSGHVPPRSYELHILASGADRTITFPVNNEYVFSTRVLQIASGQKATIVFRYLVISGVGRYVAGFGPEYSMVTV